MSNGTTLINQLPPQDISSHLQQITQNTIHGQNNGSQNVNMVINENTIYRKNTNQEKRLTTEDMNEKIHSLNSTFVTQPSQIPQSTVRQDNMNNMNNMSEQLYQQPTVNTLQGNDVGHLINSLNQINSQHSNVTRLPIHQIQTQPNNIDQAALANYMTENTHTNYLSHRTNDYNNYSNYDNTYRIENDQGTFYQKLFDELKIPLVICCLFFIFQLPFYKQNLHRHFKFLFQSDGNMNLYGYVSSSILFSLGYFVLNKLIHHTSRK